MSLTVSRADVNSWEDSSEKSLTLRQRLSRRFRTELIFSTIMVCLLASLRLYTNSTLTSARVTIVRTRDATRMVVTLVL